MTKVIETKTMAMVRVTQYLNAHYDQDIQLADMADMACMAYSTFCRNFKTCLGKQFSRYLVDTRLDQVARRLLESDADINEIGYACGFNTQTNFNRQFRKRYGCSPKEYRKQYINCPQ